MNDWAFIDFIRAFVPGWLSKATSLKVFSLVVLVLLVVIVAVKVEASIA